MLYSKTAAGDHRFEHGKGCKGCGLARCGYTSRCASNRKEQERPAYANAYPSPPMSGSLPPTSAGAPAASDPSQNRERRLQSIQRDVTRHGLPHQQFASDPRRPAAVVDSATQQAYQPGNPAVGPYSFQRPETASHRPLSYPQMLGPGIHQAQYMTPNPASGPVGYPVTARPQTMENPPYTSPKSQRKTKGHVASACVPCKKAHLRCDSQRPCSRCIANGKDDACVDVQHKKRGRPRLRDDRDARYDPSRLPLPQDVGPRRPLQVYPASGSGASGESSGPRFLDKASAADANIYTSPLSIATRAPEPVLYLTLDLDIVKASTTFMDITGTSDLIGRKLADLVVPGDRERVLALRAQLHDEQKREQPNYLPPILDRGHQILQGLGFASEDVNRYKFEHQEYWHFVGADGHARPCPVRIGLAKEGSFFFVAALLNSPNRYAYPSPSPHSRDGSAMYHGPPRTPQSAYTQHTPVSATFDPARHMLSEGPLVPRPSGPPSAPLVAHSPGLSTGIPSYSPTPTRADFPGPSPSYAIPRSNPTLGSRVMGQPSYQLPPIRSQPGVGTYPSSPDLGQQREERQRDGRSSRVDIGGLIDRPEASGGSR
ncbi:hypothetical protein NLU13_0461 [Sarocladium strictum]|uniref:Zn(2)-C6 fungal-type domain-containing protein n=1 Tax=Sarocladium strictum TaxID=5046 RepID=A0AA39GPV8_SARSR|nr:hypothetical protein NLU13_0461 [Sarocladium strictum]